MGRGVRGWAGSSRHFPHGLHAGSLFSLTTSVVLFLNRSSPPAVRGRPCFAGIVGPPGGGGVSGLFCISFECCGLSRVSLWREIPVLGKQWLRLLPQPIAFCIQDGKGRPQEGVSFLKSEEPPGLWLFSV